jgi:hypothetical protein
MGKFHQAWEHRFVDPEFIPEVAKRVRNLAVLAHVEQQHAAWRTIVALKGDEAREAWEALGHGSSFGEFQAWQARTKAWLEEHGKSETRRLLVQMPAARVWLHDHTPHTDDDRAESAKRADAKKPK